jgi:hypothetical protein
MRYRAGDSAPALRRVAISDLVSVWRILLQGQFPDFRQLSTHRFFFIVEVDIFESRE